MVVVGGVHQTTMLVSGFPVMSATVRSLLEDRFTEVRLLLWQFKVLRMMHSETSRCVRWLPEHSKS